MLWTTSSLSTMLEYANKQTQFASALFLRRYLLFKACLTSGNHEARYTYVTYHYALRVCVTTNNHNMVVVADGILL